MKKIKKYPMSESQLAQINCLKETCIFQDTGNCSNISPAITVNSSNSAICWSYKIILEDEN